MTVDEITSAPRTCCICSDELVDWPCGANNPDPVVADGDCCNHCNEHTVLPARQEAGR